MHDELLVYSELYDELINYYRWKEEYTTAIQWSYAMLAHNARRDKMNWMNDMRLLGELYLEADDLDAGFTLFMRCLQMNPSDIATYNVLGMTLLQCEIGDLAVEVMDVALPMITDEFEFLREQWEEFREEGVMVMSESPSRLGELSPSVLTEFRAVLHAPQSGDTPEPLLYLEPIAGLTAFPPMNPPFLPPFKPIPNHSSLNSYISLSTMTCWIRPLQIVP